jgi:hypothetical protein
MRQESTTEKRALCLVSSMFSFSVLCLLFLSRCDKKLTIDPKDPNVLYAAGFESSAMRSADHGLHWTRILGFNFKWGQRVIPDPLNLDEIYITTFGGSVWHGAVSGKPQPVDIATPVLDPGQ